MKKFVFLDIDDTLFDTDSFIKAKLKKFFLYPDVEDGLVELSKIATLGIFSKGDVEFQHKKLHETNIKKYFSSEHIFIVDDKVSVINSLLHAYSKKGQVFLIEDRLPLLQELKKEFPSLFAIWIKRGRYASMQQAIKNFEPDAVVENLQDAIPVIALVEKK